MKDREEGKITFTKLINFKRDTNRLMSNPNLFNHKKFLHCHKGISRKIPEYLDVKVANAILGDGFSSRFVKNH